MPSKMPSNSSTAAEVLFSWLKLELVLCRVQMNKLTRYLPWAVFTTSYRVVRRQDPDPSGSLSKTCPVSSVSVSVSASVSVSSVSVSVSIPSVSPSPIQAFIFFCRQHHIIVILRYRITRITREPVLRTQTWIRSISMTRSEISTSVESTVIIQSWILTGSKYI